MVKPCAILWHLKTNYRNFITRNSLFSPTSNVGKLLEWEKETFQLHVNYVQQKGLFSQILKGSENRPFLLLHKDWLVFFKAGILPVLYGRFFTSRNVMWLVGEYWAQHYSISWYLVLGSTEACSRAYPLWYSHFKWSPADDPACSLEKKTLESSLE